MKERTTVSYICEYCYTSYSTPEKATACEERHVKIKDISAVGYAKSSDKYPISITLRMDDDALVAYDKRPVDDRWC